MQPMRTETLPENDLERIWQNFMIRVHVDANVDCVNFLGSVEHYKKLFMKANEAEEKEL